jgi:hypothetical protein
MEAIDVKIANTSESCVLHRHPRFFCSNKKNRQLKSLGLIKLLVIAPEEH